MCIFVTIFLMVKLEFSYKRMFSQNIKLFLLLFMVMDLILEQLFVRLIMSEALLVSPILGTFVITEFIMTMSAEDLRAFIISYFIETSIVVLSRIYIGPLIEKIEYHTQKAIIGLSLKFRLFRRCFKNILAKQLATQLQLMSLNEYNQKMLLKMDDKHNKRRFEFQREKGEGLEALLGSVNSYSSQTMALFMIPPTLTFIMLFANETKIA